MMELNEAEATASFTRLIEESVKSWFTHFNFFLHNLAQLRFSAQNSKGQMLSFAAKAYSHTTEPRILNIECFGYQKRYDPQKYYVYILKVFRESQREPTFVFRSYLELVELYEKLCMMFPSAKWRQTLSKGSRIGRTNVQNVAQKRLTDVQQFVQSLVGQPEEVFHVRNNILSSVIWLLKTLGSLCSVIWSIHFSTLSHGTPTICRQTRKVLS